MDTSLIRMLCAGLALVFGAVIFLRRRGHKAE